MRQRRHGHQQGWAGLLAPAGARCPLQTLLLPVLTEMHSFPRLFPSLSLLSLSLFPLFLYFYRQILKRMLTWRVRQVRSPLLLMLGMGMSLSQASRGTGSMCRGGTPGSSPPAGSQGRL